MLVQVKKLIHCTYESEMDLGYQQCSSTLGLKILLAVYCGGHAILWNEVDEIEKGVRLVS